MSGDNNNLILGLVLKVPGRDAVVAVRELGIKPWASTLEKVCADLIADHYKVVADPNAQPYVDGSVKNIGDLVGELVGLIPSLPGNTGQKVVFEKHGGYFSITEVEFDPYQPPTDEYDSDGTDMVLLTGPED